MTLNFLIWLLVNGVVAIASLASAIFLYRLSSLRRERSRLEDSTARTATVEGVPDPAGSGLEASDAALGFTREVRRGEFDHAPDSAGAKVVVHDDQLRKDSNDAW